MARCTVERLMRANRWRGVTRGRKVRTTVPDPAHSRAPDLVKRNFTAERPGQLHVAGFTYVPLDSGFRLHGVLHRRVRRADRRLGSLRPAGGRVT